MFNGIEIWRLSRPVQNLDPMGIEEVCGQIWGVLGIIILLENNVSSRNPRIFHALQQPLLQNLHILISLHPSLNLNHDSHSIQPHTMIFPPPCFTVGSTSLSKSGWPFFFHTYFCPSDPNLLILVSSNQITHFQSSTVQCWYFRAKAKHCLLWCLERNGFFFFTTATKSSLLSAFLMVCTETGLGSVLLRFWATSTAFSALPDWIFMKIALLSLGDSLGQHPLLRFSSLESIS